MYVVGYPRSGNTWLSYLLAYCLNMEFDDNDNPGIHPRGEKIRNLVKGGLPHTSYANRFGKILKTHNINNRALQSEIFVYIVRDVRDVMISYYHFKHDFQASRLNSNRNRHSYSHFIKEFRARFVQDQTETMEQFIVSHLDLWCKHVRRAQQQSDGLKIRYEDLNQSAEGTLIDLFHHLDVKIDRQVLMTALELFNFKTMSGREQGVTDNKSFCRSGMVNGWVGQLTPIELEYIRSHAGHLMRQLGYDI
jgi:hypothetical protein